MAFYNYIFARKHKGKFIVRIEDTDQSRLVPGTATEIEEILEWAGLKPDESPTQGGPYGPYIQSQRLKLYRDKANELLESGKAYRCFCSSDRLDLLRKHQARNREKIRYDRKCLHLTQKQIEQKLNENVGSHVIRLELKPGLTTFDDVVFGRVSTDLVSAMESDPILLKSDKFPTYHLANVIDDHTMNISHVLRGLEWLSSTGKHVQIYRAFGWTMPQFAHFPLITMQDGKKMSKRDAESRVTSYIDSGYTPLAILNFLTSMGGGLPKAKLDSTDCWEINEIVEKFEFERVIRHPGSADLDRLNLYNSYDLRNKWDTNPEIIISQVRKLLAEHKLDSDLDDKSVSTIVNNFIRERIKTLNDLVSPENKFVWRYQELNWPLDSYKGKGWNLKKIVQDVIELVDTDYTTDKTLFYQKLDKIAETHAMDRPVLLRMIRKLLTNRSSGLPIIEIFECLGKERLKEYLIKGLDYVS